MNHILELNHKKYLIRREYNKLLLLSYPQLSLLHKYYQAHSFATLNPITKELMAISSNQINILTTALNPLQLINTHQSFVDWKPNGGILMAHTLVLYGTHSIVFYRRGNMLQKTWEIEVLQDIQEVRGSPGDQTIAMKVNQPDNTLFLWNMLEPTVKPAQEIILTHSILQWEFVRKDLLAILTTEELRIYTRGDEAQFNLYHYYLLKGRSFCWVEHPWIGKPNRVSINSLVVMEGQGKVKVVELYGLQRRVLQSQMQVIGSTVLKYKEVNMKRVLGCWKFNNEIGMVCETKHHELFAIQLTSTLSLVHLKAYQQCLGAEVNEAYGSGDLVLVQDRTRWKYYKFTSAGNYQLLYEVDCQKAFLGSEKRLYYLNEQALNIVKIGGQRIEPIPFKYPSKDKVHHLLSDEDSCYLVAGIRFYRIANGSVASAGLAIRNQRVDLIATDSLMQTLTYQLGRQKMLLSYRLMGQKMAASICKSSQKEVVGMRGGRWLQKDMYQIILGQGEKQLSKFSISRLLKILQSQNKYYDYSVQGINNDGIVLIMKNYVFFLQVVEDEKSCEIVFIKRMNTVLYHRFSPQIVNPKLIDPQALSFWVGNRVIRLDGKVNPRALVDPYNPPQTLMGKQLQLKRMNPPHHPKILQLLLQTNNITLLLEVLKTVNLWIVGESPKLEQLYEVLTVQFVKSVLDRNREEDLSRWVEQEKQENADFLHQLGAKVLQDLQKIQLRQKAPFNFQSLLESFSFYISNARLVDFFSQSTLILSKSTIMKGKPLTSMSVAHLMHSLNKEEAAAALKPEKACWDWIKDCSAALWIDNKETLKKWIEEIAMQEYRNKKEPFDCLFWYLMIGKVSLLATLFKKHKMDSKQHDAIANFLHRDFQQPKNRSAAIKNAYVLIDKKRYLHALAFFILGRSLDDCVRMCTDRLKDLNLAYLFVLFFKEAKSDYLLQEMKKGDIWVRHISFKLGGQHIKSYNCLFEECQYGGWKFQPGLTGFHPAVMEFSQRVRNSIGVKRQLDAQNQVNQVSNDIFADFNSSSGPTALEEEREKVMLMGEEEDLKTKSVNYYLKEGVPLLALTLDETNEEAKEAYAFELYKLGGKVEASMLGVVLGLQDRLNVLKCYLSSGKGGKVVDYIRAEIQKFKVALQKVYIIGVLKTRKAVLGEVLSFANFAQNVVLLQVTEELLGDSFQQFVRLKNELSELSVASCVIVCLLVQDYQWILPSLEQLNQHHYNSNPELWQKLKERYYQVVEQTKAKQLKQMDHFQHAFITTYRTYQKQQIHRNQLQITIQEAAVLLLKTCVVRYLAHQKLTINHQLLYLSQQMKEYLQNWLPPSRLNDLYDQFKLLLRQGTQAKLKMPVLGRVFDQNFTEVFDLMAVVHKGYIDQHVTGVAFQEGTGQLQAIEVFRNKQEGVKSFVINKHEGKGLECIVLFKRLVKKFELCQNLAKRQRTKDGYGLLNEDSGYTNVSHADPSSYLKNKYLAPVEQALKYITSQRKSYNEKEFPRACTNFSQKSYLRQVEAPYLDYNQLNSIECHPYLPFFLIGGKGLIQVAHLNTLRNFDRLKCSGMAEIVKLHACGQRVGAVDSSGNFQIYNFDPSYHNNCIYSLKKSNILNFCFLKPSVVAIISNNSLHVIDTLIHPTRQLKFKQNFTKDPIGVSCTHDNRVVVLRKNEVLIYDIRNQKLQSSKDLKGKGRSVHVDGNLLYVGLTDSKVKVFDIDSTSEASQTIRVGLGDEKEREKISIDQIYGHDQITVAMSSDGCIYYLPKVSQDRLRN